MLLISFITTFLQKSLGFDAVTGGVKFWQSDAAHLKLHQMFSGSPERKKDGLESQREQYMSYKDSFVKYIKFDPDNPNLGRYFFSTRQKVTSASQVCW